MLCPYCGADDTRVVDSRPAEGGSTIRRRRECESCQNRFTTYERREYALVVRKRDGSAEPFSPAKVVSGVSRAMAGRDVVPGTLEGLAGAIEAFAEEHGPEVDSAEIGRRVLEALRDLDEVAYLRFASVHKEFEAAGDFEREVAALEDRTDAPAE
ncbi:MAG: transcriptional regulator NrdR [Acidimicrobiia bacterium]